MRTPERLEPIGDVRAMHVRSAHLISKIHQQLGDAAHADAAHADEMNAPGPVQHASGAVTTHGACKPQDDVHNPVRRVGPREAAAPPPTSRAARGLSAASASMRSASSSPVSIRLFDHLRGAGGLQRLRVPALMIVGGRRQRNQDRRPARRRDLRQRGRPGPRNDQARRRFTSRSIASMNRSTRPCTPLR